MRDRLQIETDEPLERVPSSTTNDGDLDILHRCGRPLEKLKLELLIRWLYDVEEPRGKYITSSFAQRAVLHAFFGHDAQSRDKVAIKHQQVNNSDSKDRVQAGNKTILYDTFPGSAKLTFTRTSDIPKLGSHHMIEHDLPFKEDSATSNSADIKPSPEISLVLTPRNEERGPQNSLGEMIMMRQNPAGSGKCNTGNITGVPASCSVEATCFSTDAPKSISFNKAGTSKYVSRDRERIPLADIRRRL